MTRRRASKRGRPHFSPVEPSPPVDPGLLGRLRKIPQNPSSLRSIRHFPFALRGIAEYLTGAPEWLAHLHSAVRRYPEPFRKIQFNSWDGTRLTGWLGLHKDASGRPVPREGIILVPGMFTTKDNAPFRRRAARIFREWGYHVLALDLRGMGESGRVFNTCGWKEAEDVEAAVDYMRARAPLDKLHVYAESLGAVAAIIACAHQARRGFRLVDGAVLAVSPYPYAAAMIRNLQRVDRGLDVTYITQWFFARLLQLQGRDYPNFEAYLKAAARHHRVTLAQLYHRSNALPAIAKVNLPLLILLAEDDPIVSLTEVTRFQAALRRRANPSLLRLPWGSHCLFEQLDPDWYWHVLHEFFDFYCVLPAPRPR